MKKCLLFCCTVAIISFFGCNKVEESIETPQIETPQEVYEYTFMLKDGIQNIEATKSSFDTDATGLFLKWDNDDQLTTITNSTSSGNTGYSYSKYSKVVVPDNGTDPITFTISSYKPLNKDDMVYCASPFIANPGSDPTSVSMSISSSQKQNVSTFDGDYLPMVAVPFPISAAITSSNGTNNEDCDAVSFYALGSVIEFDVFSPNGTYAGENIQTITFTTSGTDYICGSFSFDMTAVTATDASKLSINGYTGQSVQVEVNSALAVSNSNVDKDHAAKVYMVVAPGTHSGTVKVITDGATYTYTVPSRVFNRASVRRFGLNLEKTGARESIPSFEKCTTQYPETGKYILVDKDVTVVATGSLTSGKKMDVASISANSDGTITCPSTYILDITKISDGVYSIANSAGEYISWLSSTDFSLVATATSDKAQWSITIGQTGDKQATIANVNDSSREIHLSSGNFRPVTSGGTKPLLYSLIENKTLESISVTGGTREFYKDDTFNYDGLVVTASFDDGTSSVVTPTSVSSPDMSTIGEKTVTVSYTYKEVTKETTYTINVNTRPAFSVTLGDTNDVLTEESEGAGVILPSRDNSGDYSFCGWSLTQITEATTTAPTIIPAGLYKPSSNVTVYPIYSTTSEVPGETTYNITTTLTANKTYVFGAVRAAASASLAYNKTVGLINVTETSPSSNWGSFVAVTPSTSGVISSSSVTAACKWTLVSKNDSAIVLKNSSNNYFWVSSDTGNKTVAVSSESTTIYLEDVHTTCKDAFMIHPSSASTNRLMLNNTSGYKMYGSTSSPTATFSPYIWFFEETSTMVSTTTYISVIN